MNNMLKKIESIMTSKRKAGIISFESLLFVLSLIYGGAVKTREAFYNRGVIRSKKLPCIVISIGNIKVIVDSRGYLSHYQISCIKN